MKHRWFKHTPLLCSAAALVSCAGAYDTDTAQYLSADGSVAPNVEGAQSVEGVEGTESVEGIEEVEVATHAEALLTTQTFPGCEEAEVKAIDAGHKIGRIVSRSAAFLECTARAAKEGVDRHKSRDGEDKLGPYVYCDKDQGASLTTEQRVSRLLNVTSSRLPVEHNCEEACGNEDADACGPPITVGQPEKIKWMGMKDTANDMATTIWHEVTHTHGYIHSSKCIPIPAGVDASEYVEDHAAPRIVGGCMQEIAEQSAASSVCKAMKCNDTELALVRNYGKFGSVDECECVPDVFNWPANENQAGDKFGASLVTGDFDGDTFEDLAVGAPGELGSKGSVYIYMGSAWGLRFGQRLTQHTSSAINYAITPLNAVFPDAVANDQFGFALAAGDLNADGKTDLIVGAPGNNNGAGGVFIFGGTTAGLKTTEVQWLDERFNGGLVEAGDRFGTALAVGNFDGSAGIDLAVGAPSEVKSGVKSGVVGVFRGVAGPLGRVSFVASDGGYLHQELGKNWLNQAGDEFGAALSSGNIDSDAVDELLIGAPGENAGNGYVFVAQRGSSSWSLSDAFTRSNSKRFGSAIAVGDFMSDATADVAVGAPNEASMAGAVHFFSGASSGTLTYRQTMPANEAGDKLGTSIAIGDVTGSTKRDVVVGSPGETFGTGPAEGILRTYVGSTTTTLAEASAAFSQADFFGISSTDTILPPENHGTDGFGNAVVLGRFAASVGTLTAAIGAPTDTVDGTKSGSVFVSTNKITQDGRKLDQVSMSYGDAWPPR